MAWCVSRDFKAGEGLERTASRPTALQPFSEKETESGMHEALKHAKAKHREREAMQRLEETLIKEFMPIVRDQLQQILQRQEHILQRQDQQFEFLQRGQSRLHDDMDFLHQSARELQQSAREQLIQQDSFPRPNADGAPRPEQPDAFWTKNAPEQPQQRADVEQGIRVEACLLRDPEVLEDTLHDLIGEFREEYAKLKEMRKDSQEDSAPSDGENKKVIAMQMKQMRESLDRTLLQVSAWAPRTLDQLNPASTSDFLRQKTGDSQRTGDSVVLSEKPARQLGANSRTRDLVSTSKSRLSMDTPKSSRTASEEELDERMDVLLGHEVERRDGDFLERLLNHRCFEIFFGSFILLNTIVMAVEMQYSGLVAGSEIGFQDVQKPAGWIKDFLKALDTVFLVIFTIELFLKLIGLRMYFFRSLWNWLDLVIVGFGLLETAVTIDLGLDPMILRLARLVKLTRFLKMFRMAGHLFVLNLIMKSVSTTLSTLLWSMMLLAMVQAVCGMLIGQLVNGFLTDPNGDPESQRSVYRYYGTFTRTVFTMFEITHVNYSRAARVLTDNVSESYAWFFVLYRCFVGFAILQVIRAVFIQQTLKVADNDKELLLMTREKERNNLIRKLGDVFALFDIEGVDAVDIKTFVNILQIPRMQVWLSALDIDSRDPEWLFRLLDLDGDGSLSKDDFIHGAAKLRGHAQSMDLFHVFDVTARLESKLDLLLPEQCRGQKRGQHPSVLVVNSDPALRHHNVKREDALVDMEEVTAISAAAF